MHILPHTNSRFTLRVSTPKKDKIKRKVMSLDYDQGGLRAPNIYVLSKSLKLSSISRLLAEERKSGESWKAIPNHILER